MAKCRVRSMTIGEGKPKICLPIVGKNDQEIIEQANSFAVYLYDLVELRIDYYEDIHDKHKVLNILKKLREIIAHPILLTYRSLREGGEIQLSDQEYLDFVTYTTQSDFIDMIDIELMSGNELVFQLVEIAHKNHKKVVMSNHDFEKTPDKQELEERIEKMEILGGDILKIAVMPTCKKDVMDLLVLTAEMSERVNHPLVTMSMGKLGKISRISGGLTGSAITFACVGKASAPGQINVVDMQNILKVMHYV